MTSICVKFILLSNTGGMVRWLKKSSNETCFTWSHMHEKSRWLTFKMAQNLDHVSFYWDGSLFQQKKIEMAQKVSHLSKKTRDWAILPFWAILKVSHFDFSCIWLHVGHISFDDFLSHLTIPPVLNMIFYFSWSFTLRFT